MKKLKKFEKFENYGKSLRKIVVRSIRNSTANCSNETSLIKHKQDFTLETLSNEPIEIIDILSAERRVKQWINQQQQTDKAELAFKAYKFYHRMNLIYIYDDFKEYITHEYCDDTAKQELLERQLERDMFCAFQNIVPRTERRRKESAIRIRNLINTGITFDQIVSTGMSLTDFEADNLYYNKFCLALNLQNIKDLNENESLLLPSSVEPTTPGMMLNKLSRSINKISNSQNQVMLDNNSDSSMDVDN
jgi:hypothetical protein